MPIRKNIKISKIKRGHHEKHKKNFLKSKKTMQREKQVKANIFKKSRSDLHKENENDVGIANVKKKKKISKDEKKKIGLPLPERIDSIDTIKPSDILDMLASSDEDSDVPLNAVNDSASDGSEMSFEESDEESNDEEHEEVTEQMEINQQTVSRKERNSTKKFKELLPIKNKSGVIPQSMEATSNKFHSQIIDSENDDEDPSMDEDSDDEELLEGNRSKDPPAKKRKILAATELFQERQQEFNLNKLKIGKICSGITEKPEDRVGSFRVLLELAQEVNVGKTKNLTSVRKLAMLSMMEVFKDILPDYRIGVTDLQAQKVKKDTLARVTYENDLLKNYKKYLCQMEIFAKALKPGKYAKRPSKEEIHIADTAIQCLCELLLSHTYFNFSTNIAQVLVIYLNCFNTSARKRIHETFVKLFKTDKRLDITRHVVRHINHLVKKKSNSVFTEVVSCLLALQIKSINPEAEKEEELKRKKMEQRKAKLISMSKREKKRKKKLAELDKEMMETEAEENKQTRNAKLTDISKLVFTIYFRILKECPKSRLLSCTLEGLAKFAHIINIEFFTDLIEVLNHLIENADLGYREQLHCIQTVFAILSGQGEALNIDPARFYTHLYRNILCVNAGKNHEDVESIVITLDNVLIKRRKNITHLRYLAFLKRLMSLSLQILHNGSLGCMAIVKNAMQLNASLDILLDTENKVGSGRFDPNIVEPEFSNANVASFYELSLLRRHYHPIVTKMAIHILSGCQMGSNILQPEVSKLQPIELFKHFNSNEMAFKPPIPPPEKKIKYTKSSDRHVFKVKDLEEACMRKNSLIGDEFNFYNEF